MDPENGDKAAVPQNESETGPFNPSAWGVNTCVYGIRPLLHLRQAMLPIADSQDMKHLKLLVVGPIAGSPAAAVDGDAPPEGDYSAEASGDHGGAREVKRRAQASERYDRYERPDRKGGKGGNRVQEKGGKGGRVVPDMGKTEILPGSYKGMWWKNTTENKLDVIVRELFSLKSAEIWRYPPGHYVQQSGPCEVFVTGAAQGLTRMPVLPRGWVTVDASTVGGPRYVKQVRRPLWVVVFRSGNEKGDIVVRKEVVLESDEVAVLMHGTTVEQVGPQVKLDDGIVRMEISFRSDPTKNYAATRGWVTVDAKSQGGPMFFQPVECDDDEDLVVEERTNGGRRSTADEAGTSSWEKNRMWKVVNPPGGVALVSQPEPFSPASGKQPPAEIFVRWLTEGEIVEQVGHSKKMRGYMVMPVRSGDDDDGDDVAWVTRRVVDKTKDGLDYQWFVEMRNGEEVDRSERRRSRRRERD